MLLLRASAVALHEACSKARAHLAAAAAELQTLLPLLLAARASPAPSTKRPSTEQLSACTGVLTVTDGAVGSAVIALAALADWLALQGDAASALVTSAAPRRLAASCATLAFLRGGAISGDLSAAQFGAALTLLEMQLASDLRLGTSAAAGGQQTEAGAGDTELSGRMARLQSDFSSLLHACRTSSEQDGFRSVGGGSVARAAQRRCEPSSLHACSLASFQRVCANLTAPELAALVKRLATAMLRGASGVGLAASVRVEVEAELLHAAVAAAAPSAIREAGAGAVAVRAALGALAGDSACLSPVTAIVTGGTRPLMAAVSILLLAAERRASFPAAARVVSRMLRVPSMAFPDGLLPARWGLFIPCCELLCALLRHRRACAHEGSACMPLSARREHPPVVPPAAHQKAIELNVCHVARHAFARRSRTMQRLLAALPAAVRPLLRALLRSFAGARPAAATSCGVDVGSCSRALARVYEIASASESVRVSPQSSTTAQPPLAAPRAAPARPVASQGAPAATQVDAKYRLHLLSDYVTETAAASCGPLPRCAVAPVGAAATALLGACAERDLQHLHSAFSAGAGGVRQAALAALREEHGRTGYTGKV